MACYIAVVAWNHGYQPDMAI